jgi:hypothetical protein
VAAFVIAQRLSAAGELEAAASVIALWFSAPKRIRAGFIRRWNHPVRVRDIQYQASSWMPRRMRAIIQRRAGYQATAPYNKPLHATCETQSREGRRYVLLEKTPLRHMLDL